MTEEKVKWEPTCKRFVAFLDLMGTKNRIQKLGHKEALKVHQVLIDSTQKMDEMFNFISIKDKPIPTIFSDSIIIVSKEISQNDLDLILAQVQAILYEAIEKGIPINGAIACGEYTFKPETAIHFGQPLVDAVNLQKDLKVYSVVLHHTIEEFLSKYDMIDSSFVVKMPTPMKSNDDELYSIDWTQNAEVKGKNPRELANKLYSVVSDQCRTYVDNTLKFVNEAASRKGRRKQQDTLIVHLNFNGKK